MQTQTGPEGIGHRSPLRGVSLAKGICDLKNLELRRDLALIEGIGKPGAEQIKAVIDDWRNAHGLELWRVSARVWALTDMDYAEFVDELKAVVEPALAGYLAEKNLQGDADHPPPVEARYTGLVPLVYKTQHELMKGLVESLASGFLLIAFVMVFVLRSPSAGMLAMLPNIFRSS